MQLHSITQKPLYMIFLDLKKAYDTLDRTQAERILRGYGVGPKIMNFIKRIWKGDTMYPKRAGYYGKPFRAQRGVRQGDIISPMVFNIMVDAVVRHCYANKLGDDESKFYADDGI